MRDGDKKYHALDLYYDEYNEKAIEFLAQGKSMAALAAHLDICEDTLYEWRKKYPDFNKACLRGRAKGQAFWEADADSNMQNKNYHATLYIFKMKSQYRVKDNYDNEQSQSIESQIGISEDKHEDIKSRVMSQQDDDSIK